jgi:adenylate cyclase
MRPLSKKDNDAIVIMTIGVLFGMAYPLFTDHLAKGPLINGLVIGILGSGFIVLNEIILNKKRIRQFKFRNLVLYKTMVYSTFLSIIVLVVVTISRSIEQHMTVREFIDAGKLHFFIYEDDYLFIVLYALIATLIFIFTYQMSRKMGQGVLWGFVTGKFHQPKEGNFVFMYLDLSNSTKIAEELGDLEYNMLLNKFFFDITESITKNYGKIYRYIGDEVCITWRANSKFKLEQAIQTFYNAQDAITAESKSYEKKFGFVPEFTAGVHCGNVVVGEIGEIKSQICFIGDALYETSLIEKACRTYNSKLLVSEALTNAYSINPSMKLSEKGNVQFNGDSKHKVYEPILNH